MIELLWIRNVERRPVKVPVALLSCADARVLSIWRKANPWADNVPLTVFGGSEMGALGDSFNAAPSDPIPWRCENAPPLARDGFVAMSSSFHDWPITRRAWHLYELAIRSVSREVAPLGQPVWVLGADADMGMLAVLAAAERGGKVAAIAAGSIGMIGAGLAAENNVNVAVVEHFAGVEA